MHIDVFHLRVTRYDAMNHVVMIYNNKKYKINQQKRMTELNGMHFVIMFFLATHRDKNQKNKK